MFFTAGLIDIIAYEQSWHSKTLEKIVSGRFVLLHYCRLINYLYQKHTSVYSLYKYSVFNNKEFLINHKRINLGAFITSKKLSPKIQIKFDSTANRLLESGIYDFLTNAEMSDQMREQNQYIRGKDNLEMLKLLNMRDTFYCIELLYSIAFLTFVVEKIWNNVCKSRNTFL